MLLEGRVITPSPRGCVCFLNIVHLGVRQLPSPSVFCVHRRYVHLHESALTCTLLTEITTALDSFPMPLWLARSEPASATNCKKNYEPTRIITSWLDTCSSTSSPSFSEVFFKIIKLRVCWHFLASLMQLSAPGLHDGRN